MGTGWEQEQDYNDDTIYIYIYIYIHEHGNLEATPRKTDQQFHPMYFLEAPGHDFVSSENPLRPLVSHELTNYLSLVMQGCNVGHIIIGPWTIWD